ncbi:hypothetical protein DRO56_01710 [Candidatus Bathyarchaeota archaeon]|nr:MAG: hypothetical protein DRO56_01710 [Candidatus Bathyarchaeota archaeon]
MNRRCLLFDASSIFMLVREFREEAPEILRGGSTISLAYYEIGNALWRECVLLKRVTPEEALGILRALFAMLRTMEVTKLEDEDGGVAILNLACELNITYCDAAYLAEAQRSGRMLVTDDEGLAEAAGRVGVKTVTSRVVGQAELE